MKKQWFHSVVVGDKLRPDPRWNSTTPGKFRKLPTECRVIDVQKKPSQSGILFTVLTLADASVTLDAGWFLGKARKT